MISNVDDSIRETTDPDQKIQAEVNQEASDDDDESNKFTIWDSRRLQLFLSDDWVKIYLPKNLRDYQIHKLFFISPDIK